MRLLPNLVETFDRIEAPAATAATIPLGCDLSIYDTDLLQGEGFQQLYDLGYREHIVSAHNPDVSVPMILRARQFGHDVSCLYCGIAGWAFGTKERAFEIAQATGIHWVALDCESYVDQPTTVADSQRAYLDTREWLQARGLYTMRYSGYSYWMNEMGGLDIGDPWWLPNYGAYSGVQPPPAPITAVWINGQLFPISIHQFSSLPALAGRDARDRNYFIAPPWRSNVPSNDEVMEVLRQLNEALVKRMAVQLVALGDYDQMLRAYDLLVANGLIHPPA